MTEVSVTRKGQITIPVELRRKFGIQEDCKVEEHGRMVIKKLHSIFDLAGNGAGKGRRQTVEEDFSVAKLLW